jgi:serine/threonine protein kinase
MATLAVRGPDYSVTKQKAIEDAKSMQDAVSEDCAQSGKEMPPYALSELIGKGSFGRVYKATATKTGQLVAVKIIDIEESDTLNPKLADTYGEFLKEVNALKLLRNSGAKNINHVIDALPVGHSMWMITEYCAGGSVATLMKPTAPGGLQEKWIIPILREVTEAIFWVHKQGIIHRDIKCANILIHEAGSVQLCDFGVAGICENKFDKRSTFIGTPHWMAPELFDKQTTYGTEVDIWAFGSMVYEIASGLPPNTHVGDLSYLGKHLKQHMPRLEGDQYSDQLKDVVAYCLEENPRMRPTIEQVQHHLYIFDTAAAYPTTSLAMLVKAFKVWEAQGGSRKSLFAPGGAQGPSELASTALAGDDWNFSTTAAFDQQVFGDTDAQAVLDVYGSRVEFDADFGEKTSRPQKGKGRRKPPNFPVLKAPIEKLFDPNTITGYDENSRNYYGRLPPPLPTSDLPLRDESKAGTDVRESLIDLDASLHGGELANFADMETIKAGAPRASVDYDLADAQDFNKPPLSDPEQFNINRRTQDWKFPIMPPPASANPEMSRFPFNEDRSAPSSAGRSGFQHQASDSMSMQGYIGGESLAVPGQNFTNRASSGSLIDLDMSMPDPGTNENRPSTAHSDVVSISGSDIGGNNPFELERHASIYVPYSIREPSIYVSDDTEYANGMAEIAAREAFDFGGPGPTRTMDNKGMRNRGYHSANHSLSSNEYSSDTEYRMPPPPQQQQQQPIPQRSSRGSASSRQDPSAPRSMGSMSSVSSMMRPMPPVPAPPSERVMSGVADSAEVKDEFRRLMGGLAESLEMVIQQFPQPANRRRTGGQADQD